MVFEGQANLGLSRVDVHLCFYQFWLAAPSIGYYHASAVMAGGFLGSVCGFGYGRGGSMKP